MTARGHSPCTNRAGGRHTLATTHSLDPRGTVLSVSHPIMEDNWGGCRHVHNNYPILRASTMSAWDLGYHQHVDWFPGPKSSHVIIERRMVLPEDEARDIHRCLYKILELYLLTTKTIHNFTL